MEKLSIIVLSTIVLLVSSALILPFTQDVFSQRYEKQPRSQQIMSGIGDLSPLSGRSGSFSVPSDATDARLTGRYQGYGGNQQIEFRVGADCTSNNADSCSKQYAREERAVSNVNVSLDSGKQYLVQFWNKSFLDDKQVEADLVLEYNVLVQVAESSGSSSGNGGGPFGGGCLIATAAFGSELTPQVQFLRSFRDNHILSTTSGTSFMNAFNAWYYSFSPQVADYEREQPWLQQTVKVSIYPLLGILTASEKAYSFVPGEYGSITAGLVASALMGAVYVAPIALSIKQVRKTRLSYRLAIAIIAASTSLVLVALTINESSTIMVTTSILIVSTLAVTAILSANAISKAAHWLYGRFSS